MNDRHPSVDVIYPKHRYKNVVVAWLSYRVVTALANSKVLLQPKHQYICTMMLLIIFNMFYKSKKSLWEVWYRNYHEYNRLSIVLILRALG